MVDEGTPEIVEKDSEGFFFVTFHGWDAALDKSARGIAKTLGATLLFELLFYVVNWDVALRYWI
jgi:hypothetical protein